jgi:hypothetical protein
LLLEKRRAECTEKNGASIIETSAVLLLYKRRVECFGKTARRMSKQAPAYIAG